MENQGERFLHSKDSQLQSSLAVELEQIRRERAGGEPEIKPAEKIAAWMEVLKKTHEGHNDDPRVMDRIKAFYHKQHVIKPDAIPESAYQLEARIARELGHGDIHITDEYREAKAAEIIANQKQSLDRWVDYLSSDDAMFPMWAKYWAFTVVTKMGKFEKKIDDEGRETARFAKRTEDTVAPFPPLNPRALALAIGAIEAKVAEKGLPKAERGRIDNTSARLSDPEFAQLLSGESFSTLYTQFLIELPAYSAEGLRDTRGRWVKYEQGSDAKPLADSLAGHPLEWCTANLDTAQTQLEGGDFYVYYSLDEEANATIPRAAIRMAGEQIAEVRGIAPNQNLDPFIAEVVEEKLEEFPDGEEYRYRSQDMRRLTELEALVASGDELTADDLYFLYEVSSEIKGFGYERDPRIDELLEGRDASADLSKVLNSLQDHCEGSLYLNRLTKGSRLPKYVDGDLWMPDLTSTEGLQLPEAVGGNLRLDSLKSAVGLQLPETVGGDLVLYGLTSAKGLQLPETVGGNLDLYRLESAEGLRLPETVGGDLVLNGLTSAEGLQLPETVGRDLYLGGLTSAEGLRLPGAIGRDLSLYGLTSAKGLQLPETVGENLDLYRLESAEGLRLPKTVGNDLKLPNLKSAEGLRLPEKIGRSLYMNSLNADDGLHLLQLSQTEVTGEIFFADRSLPGMV